ncbi:MAG: hypothetical protein LKF30_04455 [Sphingobium sp.]|jgi:hypothetical protein|nr:hypothetical protein [Sphingobium sp.]MCI1271880.1 hypothetical protein [Sphingobium sp.]MCI1756419.1 hypothetical protein [Sphingobium sp.]MCI2051884.1 hypothetical protein [Sphingobium sp.]
MTPVTTADRARERDALLHRMNAHPERDWSKERDRLAILNRMIQGSAAAV